MPSYPFFSLSPNQHTFSQNLISYRFLFESCVLRGVVSSARSVQPFTLIRKGASTSSSQLIPEEYNLEGPGSKQHRNT